LCICAKLYNKKKIMFIEFHIQTPINFATNKKINNLKELKGVYLLSNLLNLIN
jgi:hypothetical protein